MTKRSLPSIWMPRFSQLYDDDRGDLKNAISKFGGMDSICKAAGLIPYAVWSKFELFSELLMELSKYRKYAHQFGTGADVGGEYSNNKFVDASKQHVDSGKLKIPTPSQMASDRFRRLSGLIRLFGGRKKLGERLGIDLQTASRLNCSCYNYDLDYNQGDFDIDFHLELMSFLRSDMMTKDPPVPQQIVMPTKDQLTEKNRHDLVKLIEAYGGFEAVGQRMGIVVRTKFDQSR